MTFQYFNPHPKGTSTAVGDCVKRAIVVTTGMDYAKVQRALNSFKRVTGAKNYNSDQNPNRYVEDVLEARRISVPKGMRAAEFCAQHPHGRYILDMEEHWSSCVEGCIYDTWDTSCEVVNFAYEIDTQPYTLPDLKNQVFRYCCTSEKVSATESVIRIYDGNGTHVEHTVPSALVAGYVLCLEHRNYPHMDLNCTRKSPRVDIYSRQSVEALIQQGFPKDTSVISFYTPIAKRKNAEPRVDYSGVCDRVFYVGVPDIDREILGDYGYTEESYLDEANALADFIYDAWSNGRDVVCQCDYGQSRSAACAAAILEHFEGRGIDVFSDYRYYPNQLVYHKVIDALHRRSAK